jgi:hypothetical protein
LRIESTVLESWAGSLVVQMPSVFVAAPDRSQQGHGDPHGRMIFPSAGLC